MIKNIKNGINKKFILIISLSLVAILLLAGIIFIYGLYSKIFNNSIPIIERTEDYVIDNTPPEDIVKASDEDVQQAAEDIPADENGEQAAVDPITEEPKTDSETDNNNDSSDDYTYASPTKEIPIYKKEQINKDVLNILLLGRDSLDPSNDRGRTDSMIVLSYNKNKGTTTLLSLQRDSLIPIEDHGWNRINTSYFFGGVGLCINTINDVFDLDIQNYAVVDFNGIVDIINKIGGVEVTLTKAEADYYNKSIGSTLTEGKNLLNGEQALVHSRNRTTGTDYDFGRARRQRDVLFTIYNKCIKIKDFSTITSLIEFGLTKVSTNLTPDFIYTMAREVINSTTPPMLKAEHMPFTGTWESAWYKKMLILKIDIKENTRLIHELLY